METYSRRKEKTKPSCPGFGQDRVNFHRTPRRGTAGGWGLTPPGQTEPGVPYPVTSHWVPLGGVAQREPSRGSGLCGAGAVRESGSVFSRVFSLSVSLLFLFPSVCCSVKLPLSRPAGFLPVFFPFSSAPQRGEGRPCGAFVASGSRNQNNLTPNFLDAGQGVWHI